jgi:hypothetical protein
VGPGQGEFDPSTERVEALERSVAKYLGENRDHLTPVRSVLLLYGTARRTGASVTFVSELEVIVTVWEKDANSSSNCTFLTGSSA